MPALKYCSIGVLVAPILWFGGLHAVRRQPSLLPFVVTLPFCVAAALLQRRFAESLAGPLAIALGIGWGGLVGSLLARRVRAASWLARTGLVVLVSALLAAASNPWTLDNTSGYMQRKAATGRDFPNTSTMAKQEAALAAFLENQCAQLGSASDLAVSLPDAPRP